MVKTSATKFKWFWAWQDEREEAWLREMSRKGYHLSSVGIPCIYTFTIGEPRDYVYRLDYQPYTKKDMNDYLQLFHDAGWEHIGVMNAWQYFRKEAREGEAPEIFTDIESKVGKYKRILMYLWIFFLPLLTVLIITWNRNPYPWLAGIKIFILAVVLLLLYAIIRIALRIRKLKRF